MENVKKLKALVYTSLCIAIVTLATMIIRIPSPKNGYINFGDIMIFATAALIGKKTSFIAGGVGSALADILGGYIIYAPGTFIIKGIEGLIFALIIKRNNISNNNILSASIASVAASLWMVFGYFIYEYFIFGIGSAIPDVPGNLIQGLVSAAAVIPIIIAVKKSGLTIKIENR